jgi:hypothetical protein
MGSMKSLMTLLHCILSELGMRCGTSTTRDWKTIASRVEHESWSFLTITMPSFSRDVEKSLGDGKGGHDLFLGFAKTGGLPRFLGGFLDLVFERGSARLLPDPSVEAIFAIRQICLLFKKIRLECSERRTQAALLQYLEVEQEVRSADSRLSSEPSLQSAFERVGGLLWTAFFQAVDNRIYNDAVLPKHGPGSTADQLRGNAKYDKRMWTSRLEEVFPSGIYLFSNPSAHFGQGEDEITFLDPAQEFPVKVTPVPKTLKTPRIIAQEPTCMQYMQQGVLAVMMEEIPRFDQTRNLVCFEEQEPNQRLALAVSIKGSLATLDLSEASDRVSNQHVRLLVSRFAALRAALDATRSRKAGVPLKSGIKNIRLAKFASMGSALCFPMEAIVFTTIIFMAIEEDLNRRLTMKDVESFYGRVRVYGDDIIIPVEHVQSVIRYLEVFGLKVNRNKSFWNGSFRESCGKDYYAGRDVTVTYVRDVLPETRLQAKQVISAVALRNQLFQAGFESAVDWLDDRIKRIGPFPIVEPTSPVLGRWAYEPYKAQKTHRDYHHPLVKGMMVTSKLPTSQLEGWGALQKFFLRAHSGQGRWLDAAGFDLLSYQRAENPRLRVRPWFLELCAVEPEHLQFAGRPVSVRIKNGWSTPY